VIKDTLNPREFYSVIKKKNFPYFINFTSTCVRTLPKRSVKKEKKKERHS